MEVLTGEIYDWTEDGRQLIVGSSVDIDIAIRRKYKTVSIVVDDGRRITTAREFISDIIDFIIENDVPCDEPLWKLTDDSGRYIYSCLMRKVCCLCGKPAELHHVDTIGMGNDRTKVNHLGRECLPLCREHHTVIHSIGKSSFCEMYHLLPVKIDKEIAKVYRLNTKGGKDSVNSKS